MVKMLVTSIFSISYNVFQSISDKFLHLGYLEFVIHISENERRKKIDEQCHGKGELMDFSNAFVCLLAPLAVGQRAYVMVRCPSSVRPSVRPSVR